MIVVTAVTTADVTAVVRTIVVKDSSTFKTDQIEIIKQFARPAPKHLLHRAHLVTETHLLSRSPLGKLDMNVAPAAASSQCRGDFGPGHKHH